MRQLFETSERTSVKARRERAVVFCARLRIIQGKRKSFFVKANEDGTLASFSNQAYLAKERAFKLFCDLHAGTAGFEKSRKRLDTIASAEAKAVAVTASATPLNSFLKGEK
jgi:hypothetical protein